MATRDDQTDTKRHQAVAYEAQDFGPTSLLQEKLNGGWTPLTAPVVHGDAKPMKLVTSSTRGAADAKTLGSLAEGDND